ncbi:MAG: carbohydrate binding domain-containing protein [Ruminococcus sp.]|nr:carbohydrate binding domain-containing protein [Ruminococcus sp.]
MTLSSSKSSLRVTFPQLLPLVKKTEPTVTTAASVTPATLHSASFNSGMDGWTSRGNTTLTTDSESYYSAGSSVKVSGRSDTWQGIAYDLSKIAKAGETYSFSAAVMQGSGADVDMMITLQYNDADGKESYSNIASETVKSKTWTKLENTSYTIPAGATNLLLYVEASSMTDFYLDDVLIASKGTKSDVTTGKGTVGEDVGKIKAVEGVDISWIDPSKPMVAISFDDGTMDPTNEKKIIDTVVKNGFHATFFYVSDWISSPDTVKYAYQNGMEIANHSKDHKKLSTLSSDQIKYEWQACNDALKNIIGTDPSKLLRLPELAYNTTVQQALSDVPLISCAIDTKDWAGASKDAILQTLNNALNDGSLKNAIVLAHENYPATAAAMEEFLPVLKAKGWQVVTISEMFAVNGKTLNGGQVYTRCQ